MASVIKKLRIDHANMSRLLDELETQIGLFHAGENADYVLMMDIMQYMSHYPDLFHHPREDLIFGKLVERDPSTRLVVNELLHKHEVLADSGKQFIDSLQTVLSEALVEREALEAQGRNYVKTLRRHINIEESQVFPLAERVLDENDWHDIENAMDAMEDPLFGSTVHREYLALYDYIRHQSE
ncbi:MAG: hemerythrin domain-containing protein [Gammaproteobacteria bacterium]